MNKICIKKDKSLVVITVKDKGKNGKVLIAMPKQNKVVVQCVNMQSKHAKATQKSAAEIKHMEGPIDASNVMYYDTKEKQGTKIGYKIENGKKGGRPKKVAKSAETPVSKGRKPTENQKRREEESKEEESKGSRGGRNGKRRLCIKKMWEDSRLE
mgnify:CR=1 FL=1